MNQEERANILAEAGNPGKKKGAHFSCSYDGRTPSDVFVGF